MENSNTMSNSKIYQMTIIGLMTAVISILGPLSIPIGLVPISLTNFAIFISLYTLGMKKAAISVIIYLLVGLAGLPVFSGFSGGASKLLGPTGGYLIGFLPMAIVAGFFIDKSTRKILSILGMILGSAVCYALGSSWLAYQANMSASAVLATGVIPFIAGDLAKIILAAYIGPRLRNSLIRAGLF